MRPKTIFCDIDGVLLWHQNAGMTGQITRSFMPPVLSGVFDALNEWDRKGYKIILTTGRKEGSRKCTEEQLAYHGISYDQLVMGITGGVRVLINDRKPDSDEDTAVAINLERNKGLEDVEI